MTITPRPPVYAVVGIVALLVIVAITVLASLGLVYGGVKLPNERVELIKKDAQRTVVVPTACTGTDLITTFNSVMTYREVNGNEYAMDESGITKLMSDIKKRPEYQSDPSCQAMLFWTAIHRSSYSEAEQAYEAVKKLYKESIFADTNIQNNSSFEGYDEALQSINPSIQEKAQE